MALNTSPSTLKNGGSDSQEGAVPLDVPLLAHFNYAGDCQVKLPVIIRSKGGRFFMKNPVRPPLEWGIGLIIRSIDFPDNFPFKLWRGPSEDSDCWDSRVLSRVAQSPHAEVFEIAHPQYLRTGSRRAKRIFCLAAVDFKLLGARLPIKGTCIDISENGLSLKLDQSTILKLGEQGSISFLKPLDMLPPINVKVIRQSINKLDNSTFLGLSFSSSYREQVSRMIEFISQKQAEKNTDSFVTTNQPASELSKTSLLKNLADNIFSTLSKQA